MKADGIIFDLDGTLWDASETLAKAWQSTKPQVSYEFQEITPNDIRQVAGMKHDLVYKEWFPELSEKQQHELMQVSGKEKIAHLKKFGGKLYDDLESTLKYLHNKYKLFIVSNCQDGYIEAFLEHHNLLSYFDDYECPGRTGLPKDENIKDVVKRNNLKLPVYVGDTQGDYDASQKAGVPFIYARYGFRDVKEYEQSIDRFADLKKIF